MVKLIVYKTNPLIDKAKHVFFWDQTSFWLNHSLSFQQSSEFIKHLLFAKNKQRNNGTFEDNKRSKNILYSSDMDGF